MSKRDYRGAAKIEPKTDLYIRCTSNAFEIIEPPSPDPTIHVNHKDALAEIRSWLVACSRQQRKAATESKRAEKRKADAAKRLAETYDIETLKKALEAKGTDAK